MAGVIALEAGPLAVSLAEVKAMLRLEGDGDDALIAGQIRTATALCEAFIGGWLIERGGEQRLAADTAWQRLGITPVVAVLAVVAGGADVPSEDWESDIDSDGCGWVRAKRPLPAGARVQFRAGLAADWNGVPEPLRAGIVRLAVHLFTHRDAPDAGPPPAAVAALWRPWRRLRLA